MIAFASGGTGDDGRDAAVIVVWVLVAAAALFWRPIPLPRCRPGRVALAGLAAMTLLVAVSARWAPLGGPALDDRVRLGLYLGVFLLATCAWPSRRVARLAEPALVAGAVTVVGYGLSERLVPDLVSFERSLGASGLLKQPITYWNAMGVLAAVAIVLAARVMGDVQRRPAWGTAAAIACAPLGAGLGLTASRGAIAALAAGLAALVLLAPERRQARAALLALGASALGGLAASLIPAVRTLEGGAAERRLQGLAALAVLGAIAAASALVERRVVPASGRTRLPRPGRALAPLAVIALAAVLVPALVGGGGRGLGGNRHDYWTVAAGVFADHPVRGAGSGAFVVEWAREREIEESVRDAHSLYLETAAELGLLGLLVLGLFFAGVVAAGRGAHRRDAALAAGPCAALVVLLMHAAVDWDWEVPAVTLPALVLAGVLVWSDDASAPAGLPKPPRWPARPSGRLSVHPRRSVSSAGSNAPALPVPVTSRTTSAPACEQLSSERLAPSTSRHTATAVAASATRSTVWAALDIRGQASLQPLW